MTTPEDRDTEPFDLDDIVRILNSRAVGRVVECTFSTRRDVTYLVEYVDADGNPQEREWSHDQLSLVRAAAEAAGTEDTEEDNVVPLRRVH